MRSYLFFPNWSWDEIFIFIWLKKVRKLYCKLKTYYGHDYNCQTLVLTVAFVGGVLMGR